MPIRTGADYIKALQDGARFGTPNSDASDLSDSEIGPLIEQYFRGGGSSTREHLRLMVVASDMVMTPFGNLVSCTNGYRAAKSIACVSVYTANTKMPRRLRDAQIRQRHGRLANDDSGL